MADKILFLSLCVWTSVYGRIAMDPLSIRDIPPIGPGGPILPIKPIKPLPPPTGSQEPLDLAFIMDTTGSMSSYIQTARENIRRVVDEIVQSSRTDIRFALIEYRDHPKEESTFVVRKHDFTSSVSTMKAWLENAQARGGGDLPEAVADALHSGTTLSWRRKAVKIAVLVSDAPPHGLDPSMDNSYPQGSPNSHDPIDMAHKLSKKGVKLYTVGCEPAIIPYKDFFMALAYIASGQYIPLDDHKVLIDAIIGSAKEELSLQQFSADIQREIQKQQASGGTVDRAQIAKKVFDQLSSQNTKTTHLLRNNKPLGGPTSGAKAIAATTSLAEARKVFTKSSAPVSSLKSGFMPMRRMGGISKMGGMDGISRGISRRLPSMSMDFVPKMASASGASSGSGGKEAFTAVEAAVSLDQIERLVNAEAAKAGA